MNFALELNIEVGDSAEELSALTKNPEPHRDEIADPSELYGSLLLSFDGERAKNADYSDPVLRLVDTWLRKVPWILAGDTETAVLRNSMHCYAFVPAGDGVEISFFEGDSAEIDEYVMEPVNVLLDAFAPESIRLGEQLLELVRSVDAGLLESNEDCKDLQRSLGEAQKAWHEYQRRQR